MSENNLGNKERNLYEEKIDRTAADNGGWTDGGGDNRRCRVCS